MSKLIPAALWLDLLGKPFREGARGPDAFDCVGLMIEMQLRLGHPIRNWGSHARLLATGKKEWERVADPQPGDAILIYSDDPPWHIGTVCGGGYMLHALPGAGVARERYNAFPWHKRIEGFYRWKI
jgi:cell wall-associated NlpC family hydrolase